eukprot:CAMPEP_0196592738 /NCGR_PEP_ID=MMETSP1081-20130531/73651_1 /TAXON_ID=36882 /ORGANISM="Pyramimonas amylifera, Strain CCMP720" /LENGTH=579 /DNA_ID=CAMNT_0041916513 /DNA_START=382 /DNA_END=2121 /DNA_ORIENTATION=-
MADGLDQLEDDLGVCNPFQKYTPEAIRAKALRSPLDYVKLTLRVAKVSLELGTFFGSLAYDAVSNDDTPDQVKIRAAQLRGLLTRLGPSFIKAGQVLANRPDVMREDYMRELVVLQDDVPAFDNKEAYKRIEEVVGGPIDQVFSFITADPVAAASLGQVYRATLRESGEEVAIKVQRPGLEPVINQDLIMFRFLAFFVDDYARKNLGTSAQLVLDEFGQKLLEELDYQQEARNLKDFYRNFKDDPYVKIPMVYTQYSGSQVLVMEWINGVRCTDPQGIRDAGIDVEEFIRVGVMSGLRQLLEFGLFHGDPHPGNVFALQDGRIAYVDFGNVAELSSRNKQVLIDAVVHAVNEDYRGMADDFIGLGFLAPGTDVEPIVPALEAIWTDCRGQGMADFNFRTVTDKFNRLVYRYPIRIPERYALVIRSLLTQEGICMTLQPEFKFLEVAFPYIAKRLLTDEDPALRERLLQVLFNNKTFQWERLENLITLASETPSPGSKGLDLSDSVLDGAKLMLTDSYIRNSLLVALTQNDRIHVEEVTRLASLLQGSVRPEVVVESALQEGPKFARNFLLQWSERILSK